MGNIFATHMYGKGIVSRIKQTVKVTDSQIKNVQISEQIFNKKNICMACNVW